MNSAGERAGRTGRRHVLLVEPVEDLRALLEEVLIEGGCRVDVAASGREMRAALARSYYDCVLVDIDQNRTLDYGLELAGIAAAAGSRIIMIPDHRTSSAMIAAKGWLQLSKPFTVSAVLALLDQAVGPSGSRAAIKLRADDAARLSRQAAVY